MSDESLLKANTDLENVVEELIIKIITEKKFQFKKADFTFDISKLEENKILVLNVDQIEINDSAFFFLKFTEHFSKKLSYTLSENIDDAFNFVEAIEKEIKDEGYRPGISSFYRSLRKFLILQIHNTFKIDFSDYTKSLSKEKSGQRLYYFINSYCGGLSYMDVPMETIYRNISHLINEVNDPAVRFNGNIGELRQSIISYCQANPKKGEVLLTYAEAQTTPVHDINSAIIQGLYASGREAFWPEVERLSKKEDWRVSVLLGLSGVPSETEEEGKKYFDLIKSEPNPQETELHNLPQILRSIITTYVIDEETKRNCFSELENLITNPNQNLRVRILSEFSYIQGFDEEKVALAKKLLLTDDFDNSLIGHVGNLFALNKSLTGFIDILHLYSEKFELAFKAEDFSSALYHFRTDQPENLSIELIKLLTHNKGQIRFIGSRILNFIAPHRGRFLFQTDILKLDALTQYKLWMSVISEIKQPGSCLPMLLPLLDTPFSFVQEAFICRMEVLTEEYGSTVLETLKEELDLENPNYRAVYERVKKNCDEFWAEIAKKRDIKELNPQYTQSELFTIYSKNHAKSFNQSLSENVTKNSIFLQFAKPITLAKGGGWKMEKRDKVQKLGQFSSSFQLPRSYFIAPENFDWDFRMSYIENWENIFKKWEAIISS